MQNISNTRLKMQVTICRIRDFVRDVPFHTYTPDLYLATSNFSPLHQHASLQLLLGQCLHIELNHLFSVFTCRPDSLDSYQWTDRAAPISLIFSLFSIFSQVALIYEQHQHEISPKHKPQSVVSTRKTTLVEQKGLGPPKTTKQGESQKERKRAGWCASVHVFKRAFSPPVGLLLGTKGLNQNA